MNRFEKVFDGNLEKISKEYVEKFKKKEKETTTNTLSSTQIPTATVNIVGTPANSSTLPNGMFKHNSHFFR